jgi:hypothetical protein
MKMNKFGIFCIAVAMALTTCTDETDLLTPDEVPSAKKGANAGKYLPGTDITDQLQSDLEAGLSITLPAGLFYLSEKVIVYGYPGGTLKGAGRDATIIKASPNFKAPADPDGFAISGMLQISSVGDVIIKAMTFLVEGEHPVEKHRNPYLVEGGYWSTSIDNAIAVLGEGISLECKDLRIKGEFVGNVEGAYNGYNVTWSIIGTGVMTPGLFNHLSVKNCVIDGAGAACIDLWQGRTAEIKDNILSNADVGVMLLENTGLATVKDCQFFNVASAFYWWNIGPYCFKDNTRDGQLMADKCE